LSWWKIFDNLRRSLVPIALVLFFIASWLLVPQLGLLATGVLLAIIALPGLLSLVAELFRKPEQLPWRMHSRGMLSSSKRTLGQIGLTLASLPNNAFLSLTAIGRTLWRVFVTRRHLLEWVTSGEVARSARTDLAGSYAAMWFAPTIAFASAVLLGVVHPAHRMVAVPFFVLWLGAPWIAWWISLPTEQPAPELSAEQVSLLRRIARKTWHFFETFVTAEENWLPPDNFQEEPAPTVAARTSPTNIGLSLLANLAARDFGYLSLGRFLERTQATIDTLHRLERHRGHFYNWYETRTLRPLIPLYVSSVDSGNLAGHLLTLACGLRELAQEKFLDPQVFAGLRDTLALVQQLAGENALPKVVLYNVNPAENYVFATMAGNFQDDSAAGKIQFGSGWWFLDQKEGIEWQLNALSNCGLLSRFIGMLTDSRSFMSYPRHEYFRRVLCNVIGGEVESSLLPNDEKLIGRMIEDICYRNAAEFFPFPQPSGMRESLHALSRA